MVNLRKELADILRDYGSYALLIKNEKKLKCSCVNELSLAPKDRCPVCLGTGYINRAERIKMRSKATSSSDTLPKVVNFTSVGDVGISLRQFYTDHTVRPKKGDLLVLCGWNDKKPILDEYTEIYEINNSEPMAGDDGRIEFFLVLAKSDPVNMELKFQNLQRNADKSTYYITAR